MSDFTFEVIREPQHRGTFISVKLFGHEIAAYSYFGIAQETDEEIIEYGKWRLAYELSQKLDE